MPTSDPITKTVWFAINGIRVHPGDERDWNLQFGTWIDIYAADNTRCHPVQYYCSAIGRAFGQKDRCEKMMELLGKYQGFNFKIVAHSNGCAVALQGLKMAGWPRVEELHLVCGACESDFNKNGLNPALVQGRIGKVIVYCAGKDMALGLARQPLAKLLGYGTMGLGKNLNVNPILGPGRVSIVDDHPWKEYGHSSCWVDENFQNTFEAITGLQTPDS